MSAAPPRPPLAPPPPGGAPAACAFTVDLVAQTRCMASGIAEPTTRGPAARARAALGR